MSYQAKILADSISPDEVRLTTFEVTFPRFILAEVNTHRVLSRNSASSRAIPSEKIIERVVEDPFVPNFNKRIKGMGVGDPLDKDDTDFARTYWLSSRDHAVIAAKALLHIDVDKSRVNRLLEPFMWHTAIITGTEWENFFNLRTAKDAQPEFQEIATRMKWLYDNIEPRRLDYSAWHLPLISASDFHGGEFRDDEDWKKISTGRCARVSYLTHDGKRDPSKDIELHDRLLESGHLSPFEHIATPLENHYDNAPQHTWSGNFRGWHQYRKDIPNESNFKGE